MWIVEVNVAGRRFVHEVHARRPFIRLGSRNFGWRPTRLRRPAPPDRTPSEVCSVFHRGQTWRHRRRGQTPPPSVGRPAPAC